MPMFPKPIFWIISCLVLPSTLMAWQNQDAGAWSISVLPSSIRMDLASGEVIDDRFIGSQQHQTQFQDVLANNWVYYGRKANLKGARGEYVSFQLVITRKDQRTLYGMKVSMQPFQRLDQSWSIPPELFLTWAVEVKNPSTGYPKASLGTGWYPDALIPYHQIQADSSKVPRRWVYPFELPDFNNRIVGQQSTIIWVDQYIPFDRKTAGPGTYHSKIEVMIGGETKSIPIELQVWDFAIPNENRLKASLQHEGFLSDMPEEDALEIYQLFKRNRIALMDPTYKPKIRIESNQIVFNWEAFDQRLKKYFSGEAFTSRHGYHFGPGYAEPIETFIVPFNVFGKHGGRGWPDVGNPADERLPANRKKYIQAIKSVRNHLGDMIDPDKTEITVYLNGLDESYFPEAWDRMVYYGRLFKTHYPEAHFRIDGGYSEEAMSVVKNDITSWASHTINYDHKKMKKYQAMSIEDWLYGPMLYESKVNSWVGSSTFIDLPLVCDRAISWSSWKYRTYSWISWGIGAGWKRAWYDPETWKDAYKAGADSDAEFTYKKLNGNGQLIYSPGIVPHVSVVCPSIRLKAMRDGVQEYEYMRLLAEKDGAKDRVDNVVNSIIGRPFGPEAIGRLDVWTFDAQQWDEARINMGQMIHEMTE